MIIVDTSVWISFFRAETNKLVSHLRELLTQGVIGLPSPVFIELLSGTSSANHSKLKRTLAALPVLYPTHNTWRRLETWVAVAVHAGERFGFADLLIGGIAADHEASLWSLDRDFFRMRKLKFLDTYEM